MLTTAAWESAMGVTATHQNTQEVCGSSRKAAASRTAKHRSEKRRQVIRVFLSQPDDLDSVLASLIAAACNR